MGRGLEYVSLASLLVAAAFGVLALNTTWAHHEDGDDEAELRAFGIKQAFFPGADVQIPYTSDALDDLDGIGLARAGGVLMLIGTVLIGTTLLAAEHHVLLGRRWVSVATVVAGILAIAVTVTGLVLLPLGISDLSTALAEAGEGTGHSWAFGLYAGIVAAAGVVAAVVMWGIAMLQGAGFRLEPVQEAPDFDG